jgi:hypothetical protein
LKPPETIQTMKVPKPPKQPKLPKRPKLPGPTKPTKPTKDKLTSSTIKTAVLGHFRFHGLWTLFSTEASEWHADILMVDPREYLVEFEVKVSIADLKEDFKKRKHEAYRKYRGKSGLVPNRLYYSVPKEMGARAREILGPYPAYGIVTVEEGTRAVEVVKSAGLIHEFHKATPKAKRIILLRMGSELIDLRRRRDKEAPEERLVPLEDDVLDLGPFALGGDDGLFEDVQ